jgi:hypothetical protein
MAAMPRYPLRIEFCRSGGIAGISLRATTTADELPEEHAAQLRALLATEAAQEPRDASGEGGADRFQYQLDLDDGQRRRSFTWGETQVPGTIRPVLATLTSLARPD